MGPDEIDLDTVWKGPPGTLSGWCRWLIVAACIATIVVGNYVWRALWESWGCDEAFYGFWVRNGVSFGMAVCGVVAFAIPLRTSRFLRLAIALPVVHLVAVLISSWLWSFIYRHVNDFHGQDGLGAMAVMPVGPVSAIAVSAWLVAAIAWGIKGRAGISEWLQTALILTLSFVFALGTWLPICCARWLHKAEYAGDALYNTLAHPGRLLLVALIPPFVAASAFTMLVTWRNAMIKRHRGWVVTIVVALLATAIASQLAPSPDAFPQSTWLYFNFMPLLLVGLGLAIVVLLIAGAVTWWRLRSATWRLRSLTPQSATIDAEVDPDHRAVVELEITSWLRSPRLWSRSFTATLPGGDVPIHGAEVLFRVPQATTRLVTGERTPVLRRGDSVLIYRLREDTIDHPFRSMHTSSQLVVTTTDARDVGFVDVALMMWRPCLAYVAIAFAIMIPVAIALLGNPAAGR